MSLLDPNLPPLTRRTAALSARAVLVLAVAVGLMALSVGVSGGMVSTILAAAAVTLVVLVLAIRLTQIWRAQAPLGAVRRFAENDPAPGFVTDPDGRLRWQNAAAEQKFTLTGAQTLIRALGDVFANPAAVVYRLQARAAAEGQAQEDIVTSRGHARITVHQLAHKHLFWRIDETGERPAARGAEALCLPVLTVGRSGMVLFINDAARQFLGKRPKTLDEILPRPPANPGDPVLLNGASGALPARVALFETSGGRREVYLWPGAATEAPISDDAVLDALPVALLRLSADGAVVLANRSAREMLGQVPPGAHLSDLVEGLGRPVMDWLADVAEARVSNRSEVLQLRRSDQELFIQVSLERLADQGGTGFVAVLNDATELKTLEAQFVQSQKMQAIGQLAGGVAHDFNNLLTAITGHCDLLLLRHDAGDPEFGDLMQIQQNANRAASLVGQLLAFSRKQTLRLEQVDLDDTLADLTHLLNRLVGEKVVLTVSHDPNLAPIRADKRQLEQVIMNLVVNARDAMPGGGEIRIETAMNHLDTELRRDRAVVPAGDYVLVRVTDHGHGIAPDKLQKVFEPFFTTKKVGEGTGLGLSTAYGIVKQSGGFIFVDSEVGKGSSFTLYFPARQGHVTVAKPRPDDLIPMPDMPVPVRPAKPPISPDTAQGGEGAILLVEDEAPVRAFASRALRMRGYTVLEAESAEDALELLRNVRVDINVFVTDVVMPGMDGPTWVRQALRDRPEARVVFMSGYAEEDFAETQARIPNSVFLPKPFSLNELVATVRAQVSGPE